MFTYLSSKLLCLLSVIYTKSGRAWLPDVEDMVLVPGWIQLGDIREGWVSVGELIQGIVHEAKRHAVHLELNLHLHCVSTI